MTEKVLYVELTPQEFEDRISKAPIAYLPLGTLEWHGEHLPLGTDGLISSGFFVELAKKIGGIVLPMLFLGPDSFKSAGGKEFYGMDIESYPSSDPQQLKGSAYWVDEPMFKHILDLILKQLKRAGFKIVVAHGHGPSTKLFVRNITEWYEKFGLDLTACWQIGETAKVGLQTDHASANETSLMMALRPDLVHIDHLPQNIKERPLGLIGRDPRKHASSEAGEHILSLQVKNMIKILKEKLAKL